MALRQKLNVNCLDQKHQFAFYFPGVENLKNLLQQSVVLEEKDLIHRVLRVTRLTIQDTFVLFNQKDNILLKLIEISKYKITVIVLESHRNQEIKPKIYFMLPILKREALEESVYSLAEMGVNEIQLVITQKSRHKLLSEKDMQRLHKIVIAAAEQSKHYAFPVIFSPKLLKDCMKGLASNNARVVFDVSGKPFLDVYKSIKQCNVDLIVGPEGGFTVFELELLKSNNFILLALTKTTLRALQAVAVSSALFRL